MIDKINTRTDKSLILDSGGIDARHLKAMKRLAPKMAFDVRTRILKTQTLGSGKRVPDIGQRNGCVVMMKDERFKGGEASWSGIVHGRYLKLRGNKKPPFKVYSGYKEAKVRAGARPVADGKLTGGMWRGLTIQLRRKKGRNLIRLYFTKSSKSAQYTTVSKRRDKRSGEVAEVVRTKNKMPNRQKAAQFQNRKRDGSRRVKPGSGKSARRDQYVTGGEFNLLEPSMKEIKKAAAKAVRMMLMA